MFTPDAIQAWSQIGSGLTVGGLLFLALGGLLYLITRNKFVTEQHLKDAIAGKDAEIAVREKYAEQQRQRAETAETLLRDNIAEVFKQTDGFVGMRESLREIKDLLARRRS